MPGMRAVVALDYKNVLNAVVKKKGKIFFNTVPFKLSRAAVGF